MHVFLTGASSFTGFWFARALVAAGHHVSATFSRASVEPYPDPYRSRVELLLPLVHPLWSAEVGSATMLRALESQRCDVVCLHGAMVGNHRSTDFPVLEAVQANTRSLRLLLAAAQRASVRAVVHTGSYYEADTGIGTQPLRAFSPYALSKELTWRFILHHCREVGMPLGKFVVANPIGPSQKEGLTSYLVTRWLNGESATVATPEYVRDHVPIDLMADCYVRFVTDACQRATPLMAVGPSCYAESLRTYSERCATRLRELLHLPCRLEFAKQESFTEPLVRVNTDSAREICPDWKEEAFWTGFASHLSSPRGE